MIGLTRQEWLWTIIIIMLGVNMIWIAYITDPILQIQRNQIVITKVGVAQNERIIDILSNGTDNTTKDLLADLGINVNVTQNNNTS